MDGQWEIYPIKPVVRQHNSVPFMNNQILMCCALFTVQVTKAELDDFKTGRGIPNCVLEVRPLVKPIPRLLHEITLNGVKPPYNELILRLSHTPSGKGISAKKHEAFLS
jgi:hypothetical protein